MNGIPGVRRVRTSSAIGLSLAYVEFAWGADIYRARQLVAERLDSVRADLPAGVHAEMTPITSITGEIMLLAVSSPGGEQSPLELRAYAEFDLRNRLLAIPGVAQVSVIGGELPEYQVLVEEDKLRLYGLTVQDVARAAGAAHSTLSAGYLPRRREPGAPHPPERPGALGGGYRRNDDQDPPRSRRHHRSGRRRAARPGAAARHRGRRGPSGRGDDPAEVPGNQHADDHRRDRRAARCTHADAARRPAHQPADLPPSRLHQPGGAQRRRGPARRGHHRVRHPGALPAERAHDAGHAHGAAPVLGGGALGPRWVGGDDQRDDPRGARDRRRQPWSTTPSSTWRTSFAA